MQTGEAMLLPTTNVLLSFADLDVGEVFVVSLSGAEELSALFDLEVEVVFADAARAELDQILGSEVSLELTVDGDAVRVVHGLVIGTNDKLTRPAVVPGAASKDGALRAGRTIVLKVAPRAHRLSLVETQEVFVDASLPSILRRKLDLAGFVEHLDYELRLGGAYPVRELVVQYKESDLRFIQRLVEDAGISFFFDHTGGRDTLVFTDHNAGLGSGNTAVLRFEEGDHGAVSELALEQRLVPAVFAVQDYNYRTPLVDVTGQHELADGFGGGVVEYAPHTKTPEEAARVARIRAEEGRVSRDRFTGRSGLVALEPGERIVLEGHAFVSQELLLTRIQHRYVSAAFGDGGVGADGTPAYSNVFEAIEARLPFRPRRVTPRPKIFGFVTGLVEPVPDAGAPGARDAVPTMDEHGRYWVRFHFDTATPGQTKASRPIRMAQSHAGAGYGMHFPLRPGVEVLLVFLDGDPDRPVIAGAVPNSATPSPVSAHNASLNRIVTSSGVSITIRDF